MGPVTTSSTTAKPAIRYLTGVSNDASRAYDRPELGLLVQPDTARYFAHRTDYAAGWAADNAFYGLGAKADPTPEQEEAAVLRWLTWITTEVAQAPEGCLFVTIPDVLRWVTLDGGQRVPVGDAAGTLERFSELAAIVRALGLPVALVAQDGLEELEVPWDELDALFLGGSTEWKLSDHARALVAEANARGKWTHMGRVNSYKRLALAADFGCDSADGTFLAYAGATAGLARITGWLEKLEVVTTR